MKFLWSVCLFVAIPAGMECQLDFSQVAWGAYELNPILAPPANADSLPISWCVVSDVWGFVEWMPEKYDFRRIDQNVALAKSLGWRTFIRIVNCGPPHPTYDYGALETPEWLDLMGLVMRYQDYREPVYWSTTYNAEWTEMLDLLIARYKDTINVKGFFVGQHVWGEMSNFWDVDGLLQQYPRYGYTKDAWLQAIFNIIDQMDRTRDVACPKKMLMSWGYGLRDNVGWLKEADWVMERFLSKNNCIWATMQLSEYGLKDKNVARWAEEIKRRGQILAIVEDHQSATPTELYNKLVAAIAYKPDAIGLTVQTWRQAWVKDVFTSLGINLNSPTPKWVNEDLDISP